MLERTSSGVLGTVFQRKQNTRMYKVIQEQTGEAGRAVGSQSESEGLRVKGPLV